MDYLLIVALLVGAVLVVRSLKERKTPRAEAAPTPAPDDESALRAQLQALEAAANPAATGDMAATLLKLAIRIFQRGDRDQAEAMLRRAVATAEQAHGPQGREVIPYLDHLSELLLALGYVKEPLALAQRALQRAEETAEAPSELAQRVLRLGSLFVEHGRYLDADALLVRAGTLLSNPSQRHDRIRSLMQLATCRIAQGRLAEAEAQHGEALTLAEEHLGPDHLEVMAVLLERSDLHRIRGQLDAAAADLRRVIDVQERTAGPQAPGLARALERLSLVLCDAARFSDALPLLKRSVEIKEAALGVAHPEVAMAVGALGELHQLSGHYAEAEPLLRRALKLREDVTGPEHPQLVPHLSRLARLLHDEGRYHEAQQLSGRILTLREGLLGPDHPGLVGNLDELVEMQRRGGDPRDAEGHFERALAIRERTLGPDHPELGFRLSSLGNLRWVLGQLRESELLQLRALSVLEKAYGDEHPSLLPSLTALGGLYFQRNDLPQAEAIARRALSIAEGHLGARHLTTVQCGENLAVILDKLGRAHEAQQVRLRTQGARINLPEPKDTLLN